MSDLLTTYEQLIQQFIGHPLTITSDTIILEPFPQMAAPSEIDCTHCDRISAREIVDLMRDILAELKVSPEQANALILKVIEGRRKVKV